MIAGLTIIFVIVALLFLLTWSDKEALKLTGAVILSALSTSALIAKGVINNEFIVFSIHTTTLLLWFLIFTKVKVKHA